MSDHVQTWKKKLRLQELVEIARKELEEGKERSQVDEILEETMVTRWKFVTSTKKQYLSDIKKILANQYILAY